MTETDKILSIVIPIYNVEQYLYDCVNSIIAQMENDIEVLLIDDGSSDKSPEICDEYAQNYRFIKSFHKKNGGLSDARNFGLKKSNGDYIQFIDPDDLLEKGAVRAVINTLTKEKPDLLQIGYENFSIKPPQNLNHRVKDEVEVVSSYDILAKLFSRKIDSYSWSFIAKKSLFSENEILFPTGKNYEDVGTSYKLIYFAKKVIVTNRIVYFYRNRLGSIANTASVKNVKDIIYVINEMKSFFDNSEMKNKFENFYVAFLLFAYYENYRSQVNAEDMKKHEEYIMSSIKNSIAPQNITNVQIKYLFGYILIKMHLFKTFQNFRIYIRREKDKFIH